MNTFHEDIPLPRSPVQTGMAAGAEAIQQALDFWHWRDMAYCSCAYAPHVLPGSLRDDPGSILLQIVRGDGFAPNPTQRLLIRAGDLARRVAIVLPPAAWDTQYEQRGIPPVVTRHIMMTVPYWWYREDDAGLLAHLLRDQIATFIASGGAEVIDPDDHHSFGHDVFQFPIGPALLDEIEIDPGY